MCPREAPPSRGPPRDSSRQARRVPSALKPSRRCAPAAAPAHGADRLRAAATRGDAGAPSRIRPRLSHGVLARTFHPPTKDDHVALHSVEPRYTGQLAPAREAEFGEQIQAGKVGSEDEADQPVYADGGCMSEGLRQKIG